MTDPYERNKIPHGPSKPKLFNPFTPFKFALWSWFWIIDTVFRGTWVEIGSNDGTAPFIFFVFIFGNALLIVLPLGLIYSLLLGLSGWSITGAIALTYMLHLFLYFTFQLHDKESREAWKDKLL